MPGQFSPPIDDWDADIKLEACRTFHERFHAEPWFVSIGVGELAATGQQILVLFIRRNGGREGIPKTWGLFPVHIASEDQRGTPHERWTVPLDKGE